ncbi:DUF4129 domain-containing protein [uncultured Maricaulis sp.]|uniref:DUF4129 domain-containing protein n=1 Tax=uncultured Maricaulis sp. TaxID=174710 RepID=UPI00260F7922|nr:DUF4129 domain-containing protein [uncultured Maricaulis sp.]
MASSPRPDPASRTASAWRPWLWLVAAIVLAIALALGLSTLFGSNRVDEVNFAAHDFVEMATQHDLQIDVESLEVEDDWRALADLAAAPDRRDNPFAGFTLARLIFWLFVALAAGALIFIVYLAFRHGAGARVDTRRAPHTGDYRPDSLGARAVAAADLPVLSLDEIAGLTDAPKALGALQRLVLVAAAEATGSVLRRSETAREALRRLPQNWTHYERVARLVRTAEHVRYGGQSIEEGGLADLVEDARKVLATTAAAT